MSDLESAYEQKEVVELSEDRAKSLQRWNLVTAFIHLACAIAIFAATDQENTVPMVTVYANVTQGDGRPIPWLPEVQQKTDVIIGYYSGVFLLLCFFDHLFVATLFRGIYERYLRKAQNPFRWIEYSISAAVMRCEIAQLSGVFSVHMLLLIFATANATMLFGLLQERMSWPWQGKPGKKPFIAFWLGCIPHMFSWAVVMSYFFNAVAYSSPEDYVWAAIIILFLLDGTFAVNMLLQQYEIGKFKDYIFGEYGYIVLSLTSKLLLAWIQFGGAQSL